MAAQKMKNGPSENKPNRGLRGGRGLRTWNFRGIEERKCGINSRSQLAEKEVEFPEVQQGKTHEISMGLAF